jgi:NADH dehydrogenase FAD-containing subunit
VQWLQHSAVGLDTNSRIITLDDGSTLHFDVLSINTGAVQDRQKIEQIVPGAREHALFVQPMETFGALWPQVVKLAHGQPLRAAVIGGGVAGIELACAISHRLGGSSVTLLAGDVPVGSNYPRCVQRRIIQVLRQRRITVIQERAVCLNATEVGLGNGTRLACDVPIVTIAAQSPDWLQGSGLMLDAQGFVAVDAFLRSTSHPNVFAAGDISTRMDRDLTHSAAYAVRAGVPLANNLRAVLAGVAPSPYVPQTQTLNLLTCGEKYAIASWRDWSAEGHWVWWLKDRMDRSFVRKYSQPARHLTR